MVDEIWVIRGSRPVLWTMPYRVRWEGERATLLRVMPPLPEHIERTLMEFFSEHFGNSFTLDQLKAVGDRMPNGVNPEETFSWERPRAIIKSEYQPEKHQDRTDFLDAAYQRGLGTSRAEVEYWWNQFCNAMLDWLVNRERPVDLYFVTLNPVPFRANWKDRIKQALRSDSLDHSLKLMTNGTMFSMTPERTLRRFVEVIHNRIWWKTTNGVENTRRTRLGEAGYAQAVRDTARRHLALGSRLYVEWARHSKEPSVFFPPSSVAGASSMEVHLWGSRMGKKNLRLRLLAHLEDGIRPRQFKIRRPKRKPKPKKPKQDPARKVVRRTRRKRETGAKRHVHKVRIIRPEVPDVWDGRGYVPPTDGRKERLARVLVLLAAQKRHAHELLGLRSEPGDHGLGAGAKQLAG